MKFRLLNFSDLRNDDQKQRYWTIEQQRANCWLELGWAYRTRSLIFKRHIDVALMKRQAE